ncbi:TPA: hypothetical protein MJA71_000204 [Klebsiella aerogenes]|nr:hypothetical protein [Klebsiella aerogenes]HBY9819204.1 hypothetical protein [Klebsiella aerogenes]
MIELAIKNALERITGMNAYPLLLPDTVQEGVTYQRISDAPVGAGLTRTGLSAVRMQVSIYLVDNYSRLLMLDQRLWSEWKAIVQGSLEDCPVSYVSRGGIQQDRVTLTNSRIQYRLVRDFIFTTPE